MFCCLFITAVSLSLRQSQQADGRKQGEQKHLGHVKSEEPKAAKDNEPTHATNGAQKGGGKESHLPPKPRIPKDARQVARSASRLLREVCEEPSGALLGSLAVG